MENLKYEKVYWFGGNSDTSLPGVANIEVLSKTATETKIRFTIPVSGKKPFWKKLMFWKK